MLALGNKIDARSMLMTLNEAEIGHEYTVLDVNTGGDEEMESFLFSLGCYSGEKITVVDKKRNLVVAIKDARYNIDPELAEAITI
ncbi:FeoA family protein [Butyrivibrio sp. NC2002]|uniref:FeoA family protein n=1 Tax=Butyrivibrio sp. NC2002 TaxID=1410610 RepID=UPI002E8E2541|nr:FeoA family protein [Butyrivibrio sp. NC2002]